MDWRPDSHYVKPRPMIILQKSTVLRKLPKTGDRASHFEDSMKQKSCEIEALNEQVNYLKEDDETLKGIIYRQSMKLNQLNEKVVKHAEECNYFWSVGGCKN